MAHIDIDPDKQDIVVHSEFRERDMIKKVPGSRWDKDDRVWRLPLSWASCIVMRGIFGDQLTVGEDLSQWSWREYNERIQPTHAVRNALEVPELMQEEPDLYPFQRAGLRFLTAAGSALIADEMGAGKTIQLIRTVVALNPESLPVLVVSPNSMKMTWAKEFSVWAPELSVTVIDGTAAKRRKQIAEESDVKIINWEALRLHSRLESFGNKTLTDKEKEPKELNEISWGTVIADEAHKAKDPNAKQTRALWALSRDANYRFAATGTPVANHPGDLWSIMNFVSPEDFPRKSKFVDRFCLVNWNAFGGMEIVGVRPEHAEEFHQIVDSRMIRRLKEVVLPQLPPKQYQERFIPMTGKQEKAYKQMAEAMLAQLEGDVIVATNPLAHMTRLSQFACAYAELNEDGDVKLSAPSNKVDALVDLLEEAGDEQVVVFAESRQLIELAAEKLDREGVSYGLLTGKVKVEQRQANIDAFQNGELRVMLVTLGAGGEGVTLTAARIAVFMQRSWSMVKNKQAEDRIHRPGQEGHVVEIIDLYTQGTIEEYRARRLEEKEERFQEVVQDEQILKAMLTYRGE